MTHEEVEEAQNLLNNVCISNAMDLVPTQKYEVPQTSSQEYGWCSRPLVCFLCAFFKVVDCSYIEWYKSKQYGSLVCLFVCCVT